MVNSIQILTQEARFVLWEYNLCKKIKYSLQKQSSGSTLKAKLLISFTGIFKTGDSQASMKQKEDYKVRHHFYNSTMTTSNKLQKNSTEWQMSKATRKKRRIECYPAQLLVLQGQNPCALCKELHFDRWQRVCGGEVSLGSPTENTHTHKHHSCLWW